jgi:hypothetical protein
MKRPLRSARRPCRSDGFKSALRLPLVESRKRRSATRSAASYAQRVRTWALAQLGHVAAGVNPFDIEELAALRRDRLNSDHVLVDLPLIVMTRGVPHETGPNAKALEEDHRRDHETPASMSRKGKLIVAAHSGHHIRLQEPELVVESIREVLSAK